MKCYLIALLIIQVDSSFGQIFPDKEKDKVFNPNRYGTYYLTLDTGRIHSIITNGINSIELVDARADTFALGYMKKGLVRAFKKIQFATPGLTELTSFCKRIIKSNTNHSQFNILMVIKDIWLSEEDSDIDSQDKIHDLNQRVYPASYVKAKFEFYLQDGEKFFPVCRLDTSILKTLPLRTYAAEYIEAALVLSLQKVFSYDLTGISKAKTPVTLSSIHDYNNTRFGLSVLKDGSLKTGVYSTFKDFKSNSPDITEFEIRKGRLGDALYVKSEDGRWVVNRSAWGYCDNNTAFIKSGDNYFQLYRIGNSFYFNGSKELIRYNYQNRNATDLEKRYMNLLSPLKINIETGNIY